MHFFFFYLSVYHTHIKVSFRTIGENKFTGPVLAPVNHVLVFIIYWLL